MRTFNHPRKNRKCKWPINILLLDDKLNILDLLLKAKHQNQVKVLMNKSIDL
jgi:hypothetical protein